MASAAYGCDSNGTSVVSASVPSTTSSRPNPHMISQAAMVKLLQLSIEEYLSDTNFGVGSLWFHGPSGQMRAARIRGLLTNIQLLVDGRQVWPLIYLIYKAGGHRLNGIITERIIYSGRLGDDLLKTVKDKRSRNIPNPETEAILDLIRQRIPYDLETDPRAERVLQYLNGEVEFPEIQTQFESLHSPISETV